MTLHNNVKETRLEQNLTQEALASLVGVTRQTIIAIEKGKFVPSVKLALQVASALHSPIGELFWLDNEQGERL